MAGSTAQEQERDAILRIAATVFVFLLWTFDAMRWFTYYSPLLFRGFDPLLPGGREVPQFLEKVFAIAPCAYAPEDHSSLPLPGLGGLFLYPAGLFVAVTYLVQFLILWYNRSPRLSLYSGMALGIIAGLMFFSSEHPSGLVIPASLALVIHGFHLRRTASQG